MLIKLGPTALPQPRMDWIVRVGDNALRRVIPSYALQRRYGSKLALLRCIVGARSCGFLVDEHGNVENWYSVNVITNPHWSWYSYPEDFVQGRS